MISHRTVVTAAAAMRAGPRRLRGAYRQWIGAVVLLSVGAVLGVHLATPGPAGNEGAKAMPSGDAEGPRSGAWTSIVLRIAKAFGRDDIPAVAAGVTFYSLLALFPGLGAFVSLYGMVANVQDARNQIAGLNGLLPGGVVSVLDDQLTRLAGIDHGQLGLAFVLGLLVAFWTSHTGVKALMAGLNVAYEEKERRGFVRLNGLSLAFTLGSIGMAMLMVATVVVLPIILGTMGLGAFTGVLWLQWPILILTTMGALSVLYRYGPSRPHGRWRLATPGAVLATSVWMAMSALFSFYVARFGHYDRTYGSLGAIIGFMIWIWLSTIVILLGAKINFEIESVYRADRRS